MNPYKPFPRLVTRLTVPVTPHAARPTAASSARATACAATRATRAAACAATMPRRPPATAAPSARVFAPQHSHTAQVKVRSIPRTERTSSETIVAQGIVSGYATARRAQPAKRIAADRSAIKQTATTQTKACSVPRTERTSSETIVAQGVVPGYATAGRAQPAKSTATDHSAVENSTADADVAAPAALAAADTASANSACTIDARARAEKVVASAIDARARAEEVGASAEASAPSVTLHVAMADEVFPTSDFPPFNLEEVFGGDRNNSPIGYLFGDSAKAVFTQDKFEERLKVFQNSVFKDCEWVSGDNYFKREDRIRSTCHKLYCLD